MRLLLERIYEPIFSKDSHGFRPGRSCHTALDDIRKSWTGVKWLININVKGYFDNIDHRILMNLLERKIDDQRFISLIKAMLKAGFLEDWVFHRTYSGTPQGSICSPIMANVYLHELDQFMENLKADFDQGKKRKRNPEYSSLCDKIVLLRKKVDKLDKTSPEALLLKSKSNNLTDIENQFPAETRKTSISKSLLLKIRRRYVDRRYRIKRGG